MLTELGAKIAPATYYEHRGRKPTVREQRDEDLRPKIAKVHLATPGQRSSGSSGSSGGPGKAPLTGARRAGDVFVHSSKTAGFDHGHTGIYTKRRTVAEAPGKGHKSRRTNVRNKTVPSGKTFLYRIGKSAKRRSAAITQVRKYYLRKPYDLNFFGNRSNGSSKLNCSELVWRAFRWSKYKRIDVDGNKGWGVYPRDIQDSGWTHRYKKTT